MLAQYCFTRECHKEITLRRVGECHVISKRIPSDCCSSVDWKATASAGSSTTCRQRPGGSAGMLKCEDLGSSDALVVLRLLWFFVWTPSRPSGILCEWLDCGPFRVCSPQRFVNRVSALNHDPPGVVVFRLRDFLSLADGRFTESVP